MEAADEAREEAARENETARKDVARLGDAAASVRDLLKDHDLRYSRPREAILGYMHEGHSHLSAEALYLALKQRGEDLSLSTVYLNLGVLTEAGLIREFRGANGESLYDRNVMPHYHLICNVTGEVRDVPALEVDGVPLGRYLKEQIEAATGWTVEEPQLHLRGTSPQAVRDDGRSD